MKRYILPGLILVALLSVIWITNHHGSAPSADAQTREHIEGGMAPPIPPGGGRLIGHQSSSTPQPLVVMRAEPYALDDASVASSHENLPFKFIGGPGTGHVENLEGKVLMESAKEMGIFGVSVSHNRERVLVEGAEGKNIVLTPATGEKLELPVYPPGANMLCMGDWYWIDDNTLLGKSGVQAVQKKGISPGCDNTTSETRLYVYDLTTQHLTEVALPDKYKQALVMVMDVSPDGHVHLALDAPPEGVEPDIGWYKIPAP